MEDETFSKMHHIKWGEGLLLIITCTNLNTFWMKIVRLGKVSCCIMQGWQPQYHTASIWFDLLLKSSGCSTVLVLHPLDVEYIIHLVVNIYIICKHVDVQYYSYNYSCTINCQLIDSHNIYKKKWSLQYILMLIRIIQMWL